MNNSSHWGRLVCLLAVNLLLGACATPPLQSSVTSIEQQLGKHYPGVNFTATSKKPTSVTFNSPLALQQTLQILLSHSPQVRMQLATLGVADAQALQAELIENPHLSIGALKPEDGGRWQLDASLSQPLLALMTRPLRRQLAGENILEVQLQLQRELQQLIAETTELYFTAIAALQHCYIQDKMLQATMAKQQLALGLYRAGNISENKFLAYDNELRRAQQQLEKRQTVAYEKQLKLLNFIGLPSTQAIDLPLELPHLPDETFLHNDLLNMANVNRADIKIAQQQKTILDNRHQLVRQQNGWRDITIGIAAEREFDGTKNIGPEVEFALPLFNRGQGKLAAIDAQKARLDARLQQLHLDADSEIAQALNAMDSARAQLKILQPALVIAEKRVDLSNREVNFMLASPFELLSIKRQQIQLAHEFTEAQKNYWQARADLELAIGHPLPATTDTEHHHSDMDHSKMNHSKHSAKHNPNTKQNHTQDHSQHQEHPND